MANPLPSNNGSISLLAERMGKGILECGDEVGVTMVTALEMLEAAVALQDTQFDFGASRGAESVAQRAFQGDMRALNNWLVTVRALLACRLGRRWSAFWAAAGFSQRAAIPDTIAGQIALGGSLITYFTDHPEFEVPSMDITAAKAAALTKAATESEKAAQEARGIKIVVGQARAVARKSALSLMSTLIANLNCKLSRNDPRWLRFGLRIPSVPITPAVPQDVTVTPFPDGTLLVRCDQTPLATRFRCRVLVVGHSDKYRLAFSNSEPTGSLRGYPPGATLQVIMQAVNESSQSRLSAPIFATVPAAATA